jgi:hypothetical protein
METRGHKPIYATFEEKKEAARKAAKEWKKNNPEKAKEQNTQFREKNKADIIETRLKKQLKEKGEGYIKKSMDMAITRLTALGKVLGMEVIIKTKPIPKDANSSNSSVQ